MNRAASLLAVLAVFAAAPVAATTFVMMSDQALVDQTPLVVEARVLSAEAAPVDGSPWTDYLIEVGEVLKGDVPGSNLIVRVPGGIGPDGIGLRLWGAPAFASGEEAVLFLRPRADGTFGVAQLMLGAFHAVEAGGEKLLVRNLAEAHEVAIPGEPEAGAEQRLPRKRAAFKQWISDRAHGVEAAADYFHHVEPGEPAPRVRSAGFGVFCDDPNTEPSEPDGPNGNCQAGSFPLRWSNFGSTAARWRLHQSGQPGLTLTQATNALVQGMAVWTNDGSTEISYQLDSPSTTTSTNGLSQHDTTNALIFEDPQDYIGEQFSCSSGGVLAVGGPWYTGAKNTHNGKQFLTIINGDIITNKGLACFFQSSPDPQRLAAQLFAHELGHTLGIGHSCESGSECSADPSANAAIMRAFIHDTGYGPDLRNDDIAAARHHYGDGSTPGPGPGGTPTAPTGLSAALQSATSAVLTWTDNATNETGFRIQQKIGNGSFTNLPNPIAARAGTGPVTTTLSGLQPSTTYTWQVRALGSTNSGFSNAVTLATPAATPAAPTGLTAAGIAPTVVLLEWDDNSINETGFLIEAASPVSGYQQVGIAPADATSFPVGGRTTGRPYTFRVTALNGTLASAPSNEASATPLPADVGPCVADGDTLCLLGDRFRVEVQWRNQRAPFNSGVGAVQPSPVAGDKTGVFSFFNAANIELIVKMLDGTGTNGFYWAFYGALSDVEYWVTIVDTATDDSQTYHNPPGTICGTGDTTAFPLSAAAAPVSASPLAAPAPLAALPAAGASGTCVPDAETLCLHDGRFEVTVDWTDPFLNTGPGIAVPGSDRTGYFWFFNAQNIELVVKILDATSISGNWWVFYGALSNVQYVITVTDTVTGGGMSYVNEPPNICGFADTDNFPDGG